MTATKGGVLIYVCTGLLLAGGVVVSVSTLWHLHRISYLFWVSDYRLELGAGMLLVAGAMLSFPASWLATKLPKRGRNLSIYSMLTCLVAASMLLMTTGLSISSGLSRCLRDPQTLNRSMLQAMPFETQVCSFRRAFANLQTELKCCGVNSPNEWSKYRSALHPPSCCGKYMNENIICVVPTFKEGCLPAVLEELRKYLDAMAAFTYSLVLILAVFLAVVTFVALNSWLANKPRSQILISHLPSLPTLIT